MSNEPVVDDYDKEITFEEFSEKLQRDLKDYTDAFKDVNEFHKGKHRYREWLKTFANWVSSPW